MSKKMNEGVEIGEQLQLIDVLPKKAKPIIKEAKLYKQFLAARQKAGKRETEQKTKIIQMVLDAGIKPLDDGVIRFSCDGITITATPREILLQVKEESE